VNRRSFITLLDGGADVTLVVNSDATVLVLTGEPIDEPMITHGPFVMNTADEIRRAISDFLSARSAPLRPRAD
jgi:quercetin 2,3-dioxygenase